MLFPTLDFGLFFLAVFAAAWLTRRQPTLRKALLVAASYFFYGYWNWTFCFLLAGSSLFNWWMGLIVAGVAEERRRRRLLLGAVGLNLLVLGYYKYYGFFIESLNGLLFDLGIERELPFLEIILPVGISFFTFQGLSYLIDVHRRVIPPTRSPLDLLLYISFFPQLVAGPIVRAQDFLPQLQRPAEPNRVYATLGCCLVVIGLFKKVVLANYLASEIVDQVFLDPIFYGPLDLLAAAYGYAVQIYCDFSAYSDIAIGVALLLGFNFQKNFDRPYRARAFREFWQRWHISLSSWLRDYLYIPLGGNRGGAWHANRNLMITMLLGGVWHGAAWTFVAWGLLHGLALVVERASGWARRYATAPRWAQALGILVVFHVVCLAWVFFRAETFEIAWTFLAGFGRVTEPLQLAAPFVVGLIVVGLAFHALPDRAVERVSNWLAALPAWLFGAGIGAAVVLIDALGPDGVAPFIYFQF